LPGQLRRRDAPGLDEACVSIEDRVVDLQSNRVIRTRVARKKPSCRQILAELICAMLVVD